LANGDSVLSPVGDILGEFHQLLIFSVHRLRAKKGKKGAEREGKLRRANTAKWRKHETQKHQTKTTARLRRRKGDRYFQKGR
jgi:hypothetical protein